MPLTTLWYWIWYYDTLFHFIVDVITQEFVGCKYIICLNFKVDVVNDWSFDADVIAYSSKMIDGICVLNDYIYAFMFYIANLAFYMFF